MDLSSIMYPVCDNGGKTIAHSMFGCQVAKDVWGLVARWCDVPLSISMSLEEWLTWVNDMKGSVLRRKRMEVIILATTWILWRFRNSTVFVGENIKKSSLFDSIVLYSFNWLKN
ncbi:unnamed protein product [Lactuca virosa]|uniref:Reverse transcriptase zinc-binding domain-containing protein n=1 Tax=Lactuca virosa TaxID=75947 RepID=A0AAU9P7B7_9ASTR|nr:unnamed protein product [Lactuca virosa]